MTCPICGRPECRSYPPFDLDALAARERRHWLHVHDRLGGREWVDPMSSPGPSPEDRALRSYVARHGCGGCP